MEKWYFINISPLKKNNKANEKHFISNIILFFYFFPTFMFFPTFIYTVSTLIFAVEREVVKSLQQER